MADSNSNKGGTAKKAAAAPKKGTEPTLAPRPDEVEDLSSAKAKPQQGAGGDADAVRENIEQAQADGSHDEGPGTDNPQVTPEHTARPPASTVNLDTKAGPLEPPQDARLQADPPQGYGLSSTDHVYAASGTGQTIAGERYEGLVDDDDNAVSVDSLFNDGGGQTFVTVEKRVYEVFYYPNTVEKAKRLLYVPGQRVNRADAERMKAAITAHEG